MEEKEIDINNEEQILKKCGCFDYFYNCEECSRELCMFYNDILSHKIKQENNFNTRQAIIDLGRIAITLNQQDKQIKELEEENLSLQEQSIRDNQNWIEETTQLKQQLHDLPKKIVEEIRKELNNIVEVGDYFDTETDEETNLLKQVDIENILDAILEKFGGKDE